MHYSYKTFIGPVKVLIYAVTAVFIAALASAQQTQPKRVDPPASPAAALGLLITQLTQEGQQFLDDGELPRAHPSIASDFPHELPDVQLALRVTKPQHRNDIIDAYIRWQLTSFNPTMPDIRDRQFQKMLDELPACTVNPLADDDFIRTMNRALEAGELSEADQKKITTALNSLDERVATSRLLNFPAMELRKWLQDHYEDAPARQIQIGIDRCTTLVHAGWPIRRYTGALEQRFIDVARDREFTESDRKIVTRAALRAVGPSRVFVGSARIVNNRVEVNFANTGIYDFDVRRWLRRMDGK